jgi:HSP20 family molecular chaperone IbpA
MLMPSIFRDNLLDDFFRFDTPMPEFHRTGGNEMMKTDIKEHEDGYELKVSLPGFKKEDIQAELKDGYLILSATTSTNNDEKDEKSGKYIRRERYTGSCSRSFYVGEELHQEDIKAKYEDGVLTLAIPKKEPAKPEVEEKKYIAIEG